MRCWLLLFLVATAFGAWPDTAVAAEVAEVAEPRYFAPKPKALEQILRSPARAVDLVFGPVGEAVMWAERVDLPNRVLDVLYFDDARTKGWFPNFSFGGEIGAALGFRLFDNAIFGGHRVGLSTLFSLRGLEEVKVEADYALPVSNGEWSARIRYQEDQNENLYVRRSAQGEAVVGGATVSRHDRASYEIDIVRAEVAGDFESGRVGWGGRFAPVYADIEGGDGSPEIPPEVDGAGGPTYLLGGDLHLELDLRNDPLRPDRGVFVRVSGGFWSGVQGESAQGEPYRYARYTADLRAHLPALHRGRSLFVRAYLDRVETVDGTVPFWDLPELDEDHALRSFPRHRFRDRGALLFNVEYRYPIWDTWDAYLFLDEGQVFQQFGDIQSSRFEWAAGFGIRLYTEESFLLRLEGARGEEGSRMRFSLDTLI